LLPLAATVVGCTLSSEPNADAPRDEPRNNTFSILGAVQPIEFRNGAYVLPGWACEATVNTDIDIHLYRNNPATSGGSFLRTAPTGEASEAAVASACSTTLGLHRFAVPLTPAELTAYPGAPIYVHGISTTGSPNLAISGDALVPDLAGRVWGQITEVTESPDQVVIAGWACQVGTTTPIDTHLYVGGAAGTGTAIASAMADQAASGEDANLAAWCRTPTASARRFRYQLARSSLSAHLGKVIHVHGIAAVPSSSPNYELEGSGARYLPPQELLLSSLLPLQGQDLMITAGTRVLIDTDAEFSHVIVHGELRCLPGQSRTLTSQGILVSGARAQLQCGTPEQRFAGSLQLRLKGGKPLVHHERPGAPPMGERALVVMDGGTLQLAGSYRTPFVRLASTVEAGTSSFALSAGVAGWQAGDVLVLGPTSFDPSDAETVTLATLSGTQATTTAGVLKHHWGETQVYQGPAGRTWTLDQRAVVANLTRNILIAPAEAVGSLGEIGGHVMVMRGGRAYLDSIELRHMGQMGNFGRYPFHWHLVGTASGQYIVNSAIHDTFNRCITVHGTSAASVHSNVCYNHFGHGYFLEDGNEIGNAIVGNVSILARRVPPARAILFSDHDNTAPNQPERFPPPANFWISNPRNAISGNIAQGGEGTGFWNSFMPELWCDAAGCRYPEGRSNVFPASAPTLLFSDNAAHGTVVGFNWDGAARGPLVGNPLNPRDRRIESVYYQPPSIPSFENLIGTKSAGAATYFRGGTAYFRSSVFADNRLSIFMAYNQVVQDSLIVGKSRFVRDAELYYRHIAGVLPFAPWVGARIYDGPLDLQGVHFADFPATPAFYEDGVDYTPVPLLFIGGSEKWSSAASAVTFSPEPMRRVMWDGHPFQGPLSNSIQDIDGTLGGKPGGVVVPDSPWNQDASCSSMGPGTQSLSCGYRVGVLHFVTAGFYRFVARRSDGVAVNVPTPTDLGDAYERKLALPGNSWVNFGPPAEHRA
jgi:cell migration-inducing and hyaluronan-binding protein